MEPNRVIKLAGIPEIRSSIKTPPRVIDVRPGVRSAPRPDPVSSWARPKSLQPQPPLQPQQQPLVRPRPQPRPRMQHQQQHLQAPPSPLPHQARPQPQVQRQTQLSPQPQVPRQSPQPPPSQHQIQYQPISPLVEDIHRDIKNLTKLLMYHMQLNPPTSAEEDALGDISMSSRDYMRKHNIL